MPRTPDRHPGPADEEGTYYESTAPAVQQGEVRYTGTRFSLYDSIGEYDPRSGTGSSLLGQAVFKIDGGLVYTTAGDVVIKEAQ